MGKILQNRIVKLTLRFLFSHVGLLILVTTYCVCGGFLFRHLEADEELENTNQANESAEEVGNYSVVLKSKIKKFVQMCKASTRQEDVTNMPYGSLEENCTNGKRFMYQQVTEFHNLIADHFRDTNGSYKGDPTYPKELKQWTVASSILFTASILTTIGYGQVAPKTQVGQLTVILYSLLAIPLMSIFLVNYGSMFGEFFFIIYQKACCHPLNKKRAKIHETHDLFEKSKKFNFDGISNKSLDSDVSHSDTANIIGDKSFDDEAQTPKEKGGILELPTHVPASLALFIAAMVCLFGIMVFSLSENWELIAAFYFTFVTLATIGFGDLVPGWNGTEISAWKMVFCAIYAVLGLSISAMVIKLVMFALTDYAERWSATIRKQVNTFKQKALKEV